MLDVEPGAVRRGGVLVVLLVALVPAFALTSVAARLYHDRQERLADEWFKRGEADLAARPADAVEDYRTAMSFTHENSQMRLRLAEALLRANRLTEARAQLVALLDAEPTNGTVNLELARLATGTNDFTAAARYFDTAINGTWDNDAEERRRAVRLEFATWLLGRGEQARAQSQLIALTADLPADSSLRTDVARLLLQAGSPSRALEQFGAVLARTPDDAEALTGAGLAALQIADYAAAHRYLITAARRGPLDAAGRDALDTATNVLELDPFARRLSSIERSRRALKAFQVAQARLASCAGQLNVALDNPESTDELRELAASGAELEPKLKKPAFARDSDLLEAVMTVVFRIENTTAARCGAPKGADLALQLIGREGRASDR